MRCRAHFEGLMSLAESKRHVVTHSSAEKRSVIFAVFAVNGAFAGKIVNGVHIVHRLLDTKTKRFSLYGTHFSTALRSKLYLVWLAFVLK